MTESESKFNIHVNPCPGSLSPWYRPPPGVTKGPTRLYDFIIFGILIDNEDGRTWFKETYNYQLPSHHRQDLSIPIRLGDLVKEEGIAFACGTAPRRLELVSDFLVITQIERGSFIHDGPEAYNEVVQEDLRPVPGVKDEEVKAWLEKESKRMVTRATTLI